MRLIDADALLENYNLNDATKYGNKNAKQQNHSYSTMYLYEIADMIEDAPTIEAVPVVHGEVVTKVGDWGVMHQECSVCGEGLEWKSYPNFCPNCGADLRKKV